jgi:hypothetical protein
MRKRSSMSDVFSTQKGSLKYFKPVKKSLRLLALQLTSLANLSIYLPAARSIITIETEGELTRIYRDMW